MRLIHSEYHEWNDMMSDVEKHYAHAELTPVRSMDPSLLYMACIESQWMRVQLDAVLNDDQVLFPLPLNSNRVLVQVHFESQVLSSVRCQPQLPPLNDVV